MANNLINRGPIHNCNVGGTGAGFMSGDPVMLGRLPGVLVSNADANNFADVDFGRPISIYDLSVKAVDTGDTTVALYDDITFTLADTPHLNKKTTGKKFGVAFEPITTPGATDTIRVAVVGD